MTDIAATLNPAATDHLPWFVVAPGQTDALLVAAAVTLILAVFGIGTLYLRLHALPDHVAHKGTKLQLQIVGVLTLIALFTHNNLFWIAALLIAIIELPDFISPLSSMAGSLKRMAPPDPDEPAAPDATFIHGHDPQPDADLPAEKA